MSDLYIPTPAELHEAGLAIPPIPVDAPRAPRLGAVASLADIVARVINCSVLDGRDSCGYDLVHQRKALILELQRALADVYPDARDHNNTVKQALLRFK